MRRFIRAVELKDFRNYEHFVLEPAEGLTILVGPNGIGKTNIIEAVSLLTRGESFRTSTWQDLPRWGSKEAAAILEAEADTGTRTQVSLSVAGGRRTYRVNGAVKRRTSDATSIVPAVVFTPEDLRLVKDSAEKRRHALDSLGSQISASYAAARAEYERILRQRNALLRSAEIAEEELEPWTERLIEQGLIVRRRRSSLLEAVSADLEEAHGLLSDGQHLSAVYRDRDAKGTREATPGEGSAGPEEGDTAERMMRCQRQRAREERARGTTLVGPHRDDIGFLIDGRDARAFGSQGQQRSIALAFKLAEVSVIERTTGTTPALLLDDVMSELDEGRRHRLARSVAERTQTLLTTTNLGYFEEDFVSAAKVVHLQ